MVGLSPPYGRHTGAQSWGDHQAGSGHVGPRRYSDDDDLSARAGPDRARGGTPRPQLFAAACAPGVTKSNQGGGTAHDEFAPGSLSAPPDTWVSHIRLAAGKSRSSLFQTIRFPRRSALELELQSPPNIVMNRARVSHGDPIGETFTYANQRNTNCTSRYVLTTKNELDSWRRLRYKRTRKITKATTAMCRHTSTSPFPLHPRSGSAVHNFSVTIEVGMAHAFLAGIPRCTGWE